MSRLPLLALPIATYGIAVLAVKLQGRHRGEDLPLEESLGGDSD